MCLVILSIIFASGGIQAASICDSDQGRLDQIVESNDNGYFGPLWIPVNRAFDKAGVLDIGVIGETGARAIEARELKLDNLSRAELSEFDKQSIKRIGESTAFTEISCPIAMTFPCRVPEVKAHESLQDIATNAIDLLTGRVTEIEPGFSLSMPGVMLRVEVQTSIKKSAQFLGVKEILVFYPYASFAVGGKLFCTQGWFGRVEPAVGDRLLITPFSPPYPTGFPVIHAEWWEAPVLEREGILRMPDTLKLEDTFRADQSLDDLVVSLT